ncbi:MAG TPA: hypothetical protein VLS49_15950, partial [Usitatibacter sp.]|nr:hypothetical protein [Usitatibacter sp.]
AAHYAKAIAARPSSPYAWAGLAEAKYRAGDTGATFETALVRALELGPGEPEVQRTVEDLGLATWDEIAPETRRAVELAIANGLRRDPAETLQIAGRRGRLAVACAQRDAVPQRSGETWVRLCKAREART